MTAAPHRTSGSESRRASRPSAPASSSCWPSSVTRGPRAARNDPSPSWAGGPRTPRATRTRPACCSRTTSRIAGRAKGRAWRNTTGSTRRNRGHSAACWRRRPFADRWGARATRRACPCVCPRWATRCSPSASANRWARARSPASSWPSRRELAGRPVVLKVSDVEGSEPQTLAQLLHANIVPIYSLHEDRRAGLRAVCMPYLGGASLSTVLARLWADSPRPVTGEQLVRALEAVEAPGPHRLSASARRPATRTETRRVPHFAPGPSTIAATRSR